MSQQLAYLNMERQDKAEEALIECLMRGVSEAAMDSLFYECGVSIKTQIHLIDEAQKRVRSQTTNEFYNFCKGVKK